MNARSEVQESWGAVEHVEDCPAERDPCTCGGYVPLAVAEKLATALQEIKRVAAIEAPPVSDEVPAKVWKIAFDTLVDYREAYPREETTG